MADAKQRFIDLSVHEVSLVDTPANEVEFLVLKRLESTEETMTTESQEAAGKGNEGGDTQPVVVESQKRATDGASADLNKVVSLIENIAKELGATPEQKADAAQVAGDAEVEKAMPGAGAKRKAFRADLQKSGVSGDALKSAMAAFDKCLAMGTEVEQKKATEPPKPAAKEDDKPVAKSAGEVAESITAEDIEAIKAKTITPARAETLKGIIEQLSKLLPSEAPAAGDGALPMADLTKALSEALAPISKQLTDVIETSKKLESRVETVEKARAPSTTLPEGEGTEKVEKAKKSFWSGAIS
jgi:hypothetical protein